MYIPKPPQQNDRKKYYCNSILYIMETKKEKNPILSFNYSAGYIYT